MGSIITPRFPPESFGTGDVPDLIEANLVDNDGDNLVDNDGDNLVDNLDEVL